MAFYIISIISLLLITCAFTHFFLQRDSIIKLITIAVFTSVFAFIFVYTGRDDWFYIVKLVSLAASLAVLYFYQADITSQRLTSALIFAALFINILEAVAAEYGRHGFTLNIITGLFLLTLIPYTLVKAEKAGTVERMTVSLGWPFLVLYIFWNFAFAAKLDFHNFNVAAVHLLLPILFTAGVAFRYIEARAVALFCLVGTSMGFEAMNAFDLYRVPMNESMLLALDIAALTALAVYLVRGPQSPFLFQLFRGKSSNNQEQQQPSS